jgi:uncharacterized protein (TIGR02679 family)
MVAWTLLDGLIQSGAVLYYSGDFDPEGLQIAEKLRFRYPGRVQLWRMVQAEYFQAGPATPLDPARLTKLHFIKDPGLVPLAAIIADTGMAAYQEGILERLAADFAGSLI